MVTGAVLFCGLTGLWAVCLRRGDVSVIDTFWAAMFFIQAVGYPLEYGNLHLNSLAVAALLGFWAVRLGLHLAARSWSGGEDRRYRRLRESVSPRHWPLVSLFAVFYLQGVLACLVGLPLLALARQSQPIAFGSVHLVGVALMVFGIGYEALADAQLRRFVEQPENRHQVCRDGLWSRSRHPNYFGNICLWWGVYLASVGALWPVLCVVSPLLMTALLVRGTGVPLLEADIHLRRPSYAEYVATTPSVVPDLGGWYRWWRQARK